MTANSPGSVAESASNTVDPGAQERRANDDELSAGFQSDPAVGVDSVDGLLTAEEFAGEFDEPRVGRFGELIANAVAAGYRDGQNRQLLAEASRCSTLIDGLLQGRAFDGWSLWDIAGHLRLPINGPFVVVAAHVLSGADEPLREIESKLRSLDISSVWRLLPDLQVGIVHVTSDQQIDMIVALVARMTTARVGVSAAFEDLRDTPRALHVARVMLRGPTDSTSSVAVFDGSILATAAVSAPETMIKTVGAALAVLMTFPTGTGRCFSTRFGRGRTVMRRCAVRLRCFFATRTRSATGCVGSRNIPADPFHGRRDVAELCLVFEVHRRLM